MTEQAPLEGKIALITGAAGGIGLGIANAMARGGARVVLGDIDAEDLDSAVREITELGGDARGVLLDVTDRSSWASVVAEVRQELGGIDVLVNNAGVSTFGVPFESIDERLWDRVLAINVTGIYNGVRAVLPDLEARAGSIVNTASMAGLLAPMHASAYSATKFAVVGLSEALREEFAERGIRVFVLCPGGVRTRLWRTSRRVKGLPEVDDAPEDVSAQSARAEMLPDEVGERLVEAMRTDQFYVLTHPHFRSFVARRHEAIDAGFEAAAGFVRHTWSPKP